MDPQRRRRIEDLFEAALDRETGEREAWLRERCGEDASLRQEVEGLLAAHHFAERIFPDGEQPHPEPLPERIGPYRPVRELGRGGMGTVYLAERADGQFRQRVAVKCIRGVSEVDPVYQRFLSERQILAGLNHPNVARLLDGGVTPQGRPYLVMEYVDGLPITDYADRQRLRVGERVALFLDVCSAVQHAHQNLVIHRDLKPSNILVTAQGEVKLLDFGIAKLVNPALAVAGMPVTRTEFRVMTPEYASPEQVRGEALTTASDVYALGLLLYELLSGRAAYRLATRSPGEIFQLVCERDPERPSARVTRAERLPAPSGGTRQVPPEEISAARETGVEGLRRQLRGDLDSIVLKALRKEPARRYGSAEQLREDLVRYLQRRPVAAHQGSRRYQAAKFLRRHRAEAAAAALVVLSLVAGLGTALWQAGLAGAERDRADRARAAAERALAESATVTRFLMELFQAGEPDGGAPAAAVTAGDLLRRGAARAEVLGDQPEVHARLLDVMGQMHHSLGEYDQAQRLLERAVELRRVAPAPDSLELAVTLLHLSWVHRARSEYDRARALVREVLEIRRRHLAADHPQLSEAWYELGWLSTGAEQERLYRQALAILQRSDGSAERQLDLRQQLATNLRRQGRLRDALEMDRTALRLAERALGPSHALTGYAMVHLADQVRDIEGDLPAAEELYRRGLELLIREHGPASVRLTHGLHGLATLQSRRGAHAEAERLQRRAYAIREAATGPDHPAMAAERSSLAALLARAGRLREAEALKREALERWTAAFGPRHVAIPRTTAALAEIVYQRGRVAEAESIYLAAARSGLLEVEPEPRAAETRRDFGRLLTRMGRFPEAERELLRSLAQLRSAYPDSHPNVHESMRALAELYRRWGRPELAGRYRAPPDTFIPY